MASISVPKMAEPNYAILADSAVDASPAFPFGVAPKIGYFALSPNVVYTPGVLPIEVVFSNLTAKSRPQDWYTPLLWCAARNVIISPRAIVYWTDTADYATITTADLDPTPVYEEGKEYVFRISAADKDNLTVTIVPMDGGDTAAYPTATLTVTDLFAGNPTFHAGFPTDAVLAFESADGVGLYAPSSLLAIKEVRLAKTDVAPTGLALSYAGVKTTLANGHDVAYFVTTHPSLYKRGDFKYALVAGQGDTNNGLFTIVGDVLRKNGTLTAGQKTIRVQVTDAYENTYTAALTVMASTTGIVNTAPSDIALSDSTVEAGTTAVGTLSTVDANEGDTFTYTKVAGTGDTDNADFNIVGAALSFAIAPTVVGTKSVRIRSTDASGLYREEAFTITIEDTTAPVMTAFTIPATDTDYEITISSLTATDAVGVTHYMITEEDVAPAFDDGGWVADPGPVTHTISVANQAGTGSYTLYAWAKDGSDNVSATSLSDTIALTIA